MLVQLKCMSENLVVDMNERDNRYHTDTMPDVMRQI